MIIKAPEIHVGDDVPWVWTVLDTHDGLAFDFSATTVRKVYVTSLDPDDYTTEIKPDSPTVNTYSLDFTLMTDGTDGKIRVANPRAALATSGTRWRRIVCDPGGGGNLTTGEGIVRSTWELFEILP